MLDRDSSDGYDVLAKETTRGTRPILNRKGGSIDNVGAALVGVVLAVQIAGDLQETALGAGDPQVAGAGIKDDLEALGWGTNGDGTIVLGVFEVGNGYWGGIGGEHASAVLGSAGHLRWCTRILGHFNLGNLRLSGARHKGEN